jgi:hypothetical protein
MKKIKKSILISSLAAVAAVSGVAVAITYPNKSTKLPPVAMEDDNIPVLGDSPCYDITTNPIQRTLYTNAQDTGKYYFNDNNPDAGQGNYRSINQIYFSRTSLTFGYSIAEESDLTDYIEDHAAADGYVPLIDVYKQKLVNNVLLAMRDENASIASLQWKKIRYYEGGTGADSNLYSPTNDIENGTMLSKNTSLLSITGATINDTDHEVV